MLQEIDYCNNMQNSGKTIIKQYIDYICKSIII